MIYRFFGAPGRNLGQTFVFDQKNVVFLAVLLLIFLWAALKKFIIFFVQGKRMASIFFSQPPTNSAF